VKRWRCNTLERHRLGALVDPVLSAALDAVDPRRLTRAWAERALPRTGPLRVLALGKAAAAMTRGLQDVAADRVVGGVVVLKHEDALPGLDVYAGGHPLPSEDSLRAGAALYAMAQAAAPGDTVVALVSGGASALAEHLRPGTTLEDLRALTRARLADGTPIESLNAQRAALSQLKRGGLARAIPAGVEVVAAVLSDVVGGTARDVGSGPFDDPRVHTELIADNDTAVTAAIEAARALGAEVERGPTLRGEARVLGRQWGTACVARSRSDRPRITIAGRETTVTLTGSGRGGRNQEFALAAADAIRDHPDALLVALATDGEDGPTDAAGAAVDGTTLAGVDATEALAHNNAYDLLDPLGALLRPGPTGTNVCDLCLALS
jgi:hydroxypyruvate reductase